MDIHQIVKGRKRYAEAYFAFLSSTPEERGEAYREWRAQYEWKQIHDPDFPCAQEQAEQWFLCVNRDARLPLRGTPEWLEMYKEYMRFQFGGEP